MKTDLATAIGAAIVGFLIAFFAANFLAGPIEDVTYKTIDAKVNASLENPNPEIFNYRAINPTVEVYVGNCVEYGQNGECIVEENANDDEFEADQENP